MHHYPNDFAPSLFLRLGFVPSWTFEIQVGDGINNEANEDQTADASMTLSRGRLDGIQSTHNPVDALIKVK
jgi:hypothetical protein